MKKFFKILCLVALIVLLLVGVIYLFRNLVIGFVLLSIIAFFAIVAIFITDRLFKNKPSMESPRKVSRVAIVVVGFAALLAMGSYFYPSSTEVYSNNDHHAIALEGIETADSHLLLAANSRDALFDNMNLAGSIALDNINPDDSTASLILSGTGTPVFQYSHKDRPWIIRKVRGVFQIKDIDYYKLIDNQDNLHQFSSGETLELFGPLSQTAVAKLRIEYYKSGKGFLNLKKIWKARYILEHTDSDGTNHIDTSSYERIICKHYSLGSLFPFIDTLNGVVFPKIELVRSRIPAANDIKPKDSKDFPFVVAFQSGSGLTSLESGNSRTSVGGIAELSIPLKGQRMSIGASKAIPDFRLDINSQGLARVRFVMPQYRYLSTESLREGDDGSFTFMVTSTLIDPNGEVNKQLSENILLYEMFDHNDNVYQMKPHYMYFQRGKTRTPLQVHVMDENGNEKVTVRAGEYLPPVATGKTGTNWIMSLDNFKDPSLARPQGVEAPLSANSMMIWIMIITVLALINMLVNDKYDNIGDMAYNGYKRYTYIEPMVYIAIITFLAIRLTMMWRVSVFPPAMGITLGEFNLWRASSNAMSWMPYVVVMMMVALFIYKLYGNYGGNNPTYTPYTYNGDKKLRKYWIKLMPIDDVKKRRWLVGLYAGWILLGIIFIVKLVDSTFWHVGVAVVYYFMVDHIIYRWLGSRLSDNGNNAFASFGHAIANNLIASLVIFIGDGGYGIIFFVFSLINVGIRLADLYGANTTTHGKGEIKLFGVLLIPLLLIAILVFMRPIISGVYVNNTTTAIWAGVATMIFVYLFAWTLGKIGKKNQEQVQSNPETTDKKMPMGVKIFLISAFTSLVVVGAIAALPKVAGDHTAYRARVLAVDDPSSVLGATTSSGDRQKFFEASLNDWVLEENVERGKSITPFIGEKGKAYFKLQPHSRVGVSWMTQLTDLSVSRFLIAEQARGLPVILIFIFAVLTLFSLFFPADRRWARSLIVQIPLLLTVQSLLVWMAVTRRFVFIGQDFPMLSIISTINTCMCFLGFFVWVSVAMSERFNLGKLGYKNDAFIPLSRGDKQKSVIYGFIHRFGTIEWSVIIIACLLIVFAKTDGRHKDNTFDVENCAAATYRLIADEDAYSVEHLFREYQDELAQNSKVRDITRLGSPAAIIRQFCDAMLYQPGDTNINSPINDVFLSDGEYGNFAKATFDYYLEKQMVQNDIENMVYVVKRRYNDSENTQIEHVRYTFDVNTHQYQAYLPTRLENAWRGSIFGHSAKSDIMPKVNTLLGTRIYTLPEGWTREHSILVRPSNSRVSVVGRYAPRHLASGEVYNLTRGEKLQGYAPDLSQYGSGNYIAQNVIINSNAAFIYPLQNHLYWANPLSAQLRGYMNRSLRNERDKDKRKQMMEEPIYLSLSTQLTEDIYRTIDGGVVDGNVAVVVADGDGYVRALVDRKKPKYRINPNNTRRIQQVEDSLRKEGMLRRGHEAERFFGNKAILWLDNGPGSSQKPIVWSAVTTQYPDWKWNNLQLAAINNILIEQDLKHYILLKWAGSTIKEPRFSSLKSDEGNGNNVNVRYYMRNSSNYYNALMTFLGSFTKQELENPDKIFTSQEDFWTTTRDDISYKAKYRDQVFPLFIYNNRYYSFSRPLDRQHAGNQNAMLPTGLRENFSLPTSSSDDDSVQYSNFHPMLGGGKRIGYYAYPQASRFNSEMRESDPTTEGVKMTAIGKHSVWLVSPLKMAEMYGKLISFNRNYRLTIDSKSPKPQYNAFSVDGDAKEYIAMRNKQFIPGLSDVFSSGTAHELNIQNPEGYHIYGKTGTINGKVDGKNQEDHLLAVVITDRDITEIRNPEGLTEMRFYVIYIADFDYYGRYNWKVNDASIINKVLQSEEFKQYMKGGNQ